MCISAGSCLVHRNGNTFGPHVAKLRTHPNTYSHIYIHSIKSKKINISSTCTQLKGMSSTLLTPLYNTLRCTNDFLLIHHPLLLYKYQHNKWHLSFRAKCEIMREEPPHPPSIQRMIPLSILSYPTWTHSHSHTYIHTSANMA